MSFLTCFGAYITGWVLCNVFLHQIAARVDSNWSKRVRAEMCSDMAEQIAEKLKEGGGAS